MYQEGRKKVVVVDDGYGNYDAEQRILDAVSADVLVRPCPPGNIAALIDATHDAHAVLVRESPINAQVIQAMQHCQAIVRYGIGVDNVDMVVAKARKIYVANVPDYGIEEVSDHAAALLMAVCRRIVTRDATVRKGGWNVARTQTMYRTAGRVLGLVGYGRIARMLERKMRGFGVSHVMVYDPFLPDAVKATAGEGVVFVDMDTLCAQSDLISVHSPLTPETRHIIDASRIALMKPTTVVVNTARGGLIDEDALVAALQKNLLFGAGLDVFEKEPLNADNPVLTCPNMIVSDHTAWYSEASVAELQHKAAEEIARVFRGEVPRNWLNKW